VKQILPTELKAIIGAMGYKDVRTIGLNSFGVVVPKTQVASVVPILRSALEEYEPKVVSDVELRIGLVSVFAKNANMQRARAGMSGGRGNEKNLQVAIREYRTDYGKPINIEFKQRHGSNIFVCKDVMEVKHVGAKNVFQRLKADVHLVTSKMTTYPISVKDFNAGSWESADSYWGERAKSFLMWALHTKQTKISRASGYYVITPPIAIAASSDELKAVVFGADIYGKGAVVVEHFNPTSFQWDFVRDVLVVLCENVILEPQDIPSASMPYFQIRNDSKRNPRWLKPGLRTVATMKNHLSGVKVFESNTRSEVGL
jgi:hypothetical protein